MTKITEAYLELENAENELKKARKIFSEKKHKFFGLVRAEARK